MSTSNAAWFSVTAEKLSDGPKVLPDLRVDAGKKCGNRGLLPGPSPSQTQQLPRFSLVTETCHSWFLPSGKTLCNIPFYLVAQQYGSSVHLMSRK